MPFLSLKVDGFALQVGRDTVESPPEQRDSLPQSKTKRKRKAQGFVTEKKVCYVAAATLLVLVANPGTHLFLEQTEPAIAARRLILGNGFRTPELPAVSSAPTVSDRLVKVALSWDGRDFRPGQPAQCTFFVRAVAEEAGIPLVVTKQPWDAQFRQPLTLGTVSGLAGPDVYPSGSTQWIESIDQIQPGDIVFLRGTYTPSWLTPEQARLALTHVGIAVGNGQMIHRPTRSAPVNRVAIDRKRFAVALRLGD